MKLVISTALALVAQSIISTSHAFAPQTFTVKPSSTTTLLMAKNKGFGKPSAQTALKKTSPQTEDAATSTPKESSTEFATAPGADALARLRRQKVEQRNEELRQIRDLKTIDKQLVQEPNSAVIPEQVAQRMGKRMLPFVGIPLFGVMATFITFWYLATYKNYEFQPALVAFSTIAVLGAGLLGITYSVMSASWDVEEEGSALGVEEFKTNLGSIRDGLKRTRENAILREKMSSLPDEEIDQAIARLNSKEESEKKKAMDLKEKLEKDLE